MEGRAAIFCDEPRINDVGRSSALSAKPYNVEKHEEKRVAEGWPEFSVCTFCVQFRRVEALFFDNQTLVLLKYQYSVYHENHNIVKCREAVIQINNFRYGRAFV
ncbi:hypothetical protein M0802_000787 [Mischocyttarus mexicanus]|nr:hypothetical protein M0802_000787 [Mischocyttarus mexicanus]